MTYCIGGCGGNGENGEYAATKKMVGMDRRTDYRKQRFFLKKLEQ